MALRLDIVLLGPPGSGKGTQALRLANREGLAHLSTGDLLRQAVAAGSDLGLRVKAIIESGRLVADEIVLELVEERLGRIGDAGVLLDGFPRTLRQASMLAEALAARGLAPPLVLELRVPPDELITRLTSRRTCPACGPRPGGESRCSVCDRPLVARADDAEPVVRERLRVHDAETAPLVSWYAEKGLLHPVVALGTPDAVAAQIASIVDAARRGRTGAPGPGA